MLWNDVLKTVQRIKTAKQGSVKELMISFRNTPMLEGIANSGTLSTWLWALTTADSCPYGSWSWRRS